MPFTKGDEPEAKPFYGYCIVVASFLIVLLGWGTFLSFGVFFDPLARTFGWGRAETAGVYSLATLIAGFAAIVMGRLNDTLGPKLVLSLCGIVVGAGYLFTSLANYLWQMYLAYGLIVGIGMAGYFVPTTSTVARWFVKKRTFMTGLVLLGVSIGMMVIPRAVAAVIEAWGWRAAFAVIGASHVVVVVFLAQILKAYPEQLSAPDQAALGAVNTGAVLQNSGSSLREALHMRQFWLLCGIYFCFYYCINSVLAHLVPYASGSGISLEKAANIMIFFGGGGIAGRFFISLLGDRIGNRITCLLCFVIMALAIFSLVKTTGLNGMSLVAAVIGFCFAGGGALLSPLIADFFGLKEHGIILGIVYACDMAGGAVGPVLAGAMFDAMGGYALAFMLSAAVAVLGCILIVLLR